MSQTMTGGALIQHTAALHSKPWAALPSAQTKPARRPSFKVRTHTRATINGADEQTSPSDPPQNEERFVSVSDLLEEVRASA